MVPKSILLPRNGWVPNNPVLPVKLYIEVEPRERTDLAETFEARFHKHGWEPEWRDQIYDYDHYHSTAHEVLGMVSGHAILALGGSKAFEIKVRAGDALLLPAGTGHRAIEQSWDFLAVGAYPAGQNWDICCVAPSQTMLDRINSLALPKYDPVTGSTF
ncbi:putative protein containing double-stranded beta helix domain protein [Sphingobium yanoikuyae]|jgi:uncharacterized protein YjlB|uniref:Cupin n=2 Tax=Sphingobium yanoikuyae TaxID=13690 RepID=A0A084E202_SPHYA|nr:cupin [Sphingobium yanoikuyae]KEZ11994.1 putative protein containing double-stranded beta helix domain protein [Sphingobium yanoikuyae]QJR05875.1 cupin [Sphingobium yanoikuyae]